MIDTAGGDLYKRFTVKGQTPHVAAVKSIETTTQLYGPDGELIGESPTTLLTSAEAALVRSYLLMLMKADLEPIFFCRSCGHETREDKAQFLINDQQIVIACKCAVLFHQGASLAYDQVALTLAARTPEPDQHLPITEAAAKLFRRWKKFLMAHGLQEELRCNVCYDSTEGDGCRASVVEQSIRIFCRCAHRTYVGVTI